MNQESLLHHDVLPRLIDATLCDLAHNRHNQYFSLGVWGEGKTLGLGVSGVGFRDRDTMLYIACVSTTGLFLGEVLIVRVGASRGYKRMWKRGMLQLGALIPLM